MSEVENILDQLHRSMFGNAWHGSSLLELLNDVTSSRAQAKPIPTAHSIWEIVLHIAVWEDITQSRIEDVTVELSNENDWQTIKDVGPDSWKSTIALLKQTHLALEQSLRTLSDKDLEKNVVGKDYSKFFLLNGALQHMVYHSGQIALLKKTFKQSLGDELISVSEKGDIELVRELLEIDASLVDFKAGYDKTPLHLAAENNHREVAELLLSYGAEIEAETTWGMTPLQWAANCGSQNVAELLLSHQAKSNMWVYAALGNLELVQEYFETPTTLKKNAGQSRTIEPQKGVWEKLPPSEDFHYVISSSFHIACRNGKLNVAEFLYERGADIHHRGFWGGTSLHWAAINGHKTIVEFLLEHGADVNMEDEEFQTTPFLWAKQGKHEEIMALLKQ